MSDPVQVATAFHKFYSGIGTKLAQKIQPFQNNFTSVFKKYMTISIFLTDTTPAVIAKLIYSHEILKDH